MTLREIRVLLIEDNPGDARLVREALASIKSVNFVVEWVDRLGAAIERLRRPDLNIVLLDLSVPDSEGFGGVDQVARAAPQTPIVALSGLDDAEVIHDAVKKGVEDYIVKGSFSGDLLARSIQYAIDRRRAHEELAEARDSALESARLRSEFLANMSHEIRTPLNAIVGMTRLLMDTRLTNDQREMLEISRQSTDSLLKIINDVLDFSKISAGKVELEKTDFDLGAALESVIAMFAGQARAKQVELASYIEGDVPVLLRGDAARLSQVMTNLIGNAVKFTPTGQVTVRVAQVSDLDDDVVLRFTVRDTGIGIPLEGQRHLFQAFSQADSSTTRKYGGTGLGLAISAQLIELMGGNIGVQSDPGNGSTFWFTAAFRKQAAASNAFPVGARLKGLRILVVDPSRTVSNIIREHVGAWGGRCEMAETAAEAMAELKDATLAGRPYDIALLELGLPDADGIALCRSIKGEAALARTRMLGMCALGSRPDERQMKEAGIRGLLVKPIKQSQLFNVLSIAMATPADLADRGPSMYRRKLSEIESRLPDEVRSRTRVLLVEDNIVNQQVQLRLLERMGYHADTVNNGREAVECLRDTEYDIGLMDCQMPEMDGYTATRELRRLERGDHHPVIIGVTAHALPGDREECLAAGMDDYISKPIVPEELASVLEKWVIAGNPELSSRSAAVRSSAGMLDENVVATLRQIQRPGEGDFLAHLLGIFLADLHQRIEDMRTMLPSRNSGAIASSAHALKGAAGQVGAVRVREICEKIETAAKAGACEGLGAMLNDLARQATLLQRTFNADDASLESDASRGS